MKKSLVLLGVSLFTWGIGEGLFAYFQPAYLKSMGADPMTIAGVYSALGVAMMLAHIPAGYLADRFGRKPLLVAAWVGGLAATWVMALAQSLPLFITGMLLYGFSAFVSAPMNSYVTAARGKLNPVRAMTLMSACFSFGAVIGPVTGGWIAEAVSLRRVYFIAAIIFVLSTAFILFIKPQARETHASSQPSTGLLSNTRFLGFVGVAFLVVFATYMPKPLTPLFLETERLMTESQIGLLGSINSLGNGLFALLLGQFSTRLGLVLVQLCVIAFSLLIWRGTGVGWYAAGYLLMGGFAPVKSFIFAEIRSLIHPAQMGMAYGITETFNSLAFVLAPLLAGALYTREPLLMYAGAVGLLGFSLLVSLVFTPRTKTGRAVPIARDLEP